MACFTIHTRGELPRKISVSGCNRLQSSTDCLRKWEEKDHHYVYK